ncbi:MAG: hypothetical protein ABI879_04185 [Actinomycetota bacterium]
MSSDEVRIADESGRLHTLSHYHLENFFLDESVWVDAFSVIEPAGSWLLAAASIREKLRRIAESFVSYAAALTVAYEIRQSVGNVDVMPSDCHGKSVDEVAGLIADRVSSESRRAASALDAGVVENRVREIFSGGRAR